MKYYSPSQKGFFDKEVHKEIPKDSVEITDEYWESLLGQEIVFDGKKPVIRVYSDKEKQEKETLSKIQEAKQYLLETDWVEMYLLKHLTKVEIIPKDSNKWEVINKRKEYKEFLSNQVLDK